MKIVIVGGGPAGLACAVALAAEGLVVEVLEAAPHLGGKVASWQDDEGDHVEVGLHVFFQGYRHLRALLARVGASDHVDWKAHEIVIYRTGGRRHRLRFPPLPAPLNGLVAFGASDLLPLAERVRLVRAMLPVWRDGLAYAEARDDQTFAAWARQQGLGPRAMELLWGPICRATGFLTAEESAARPLVTVFHHFATDGAASRVGFLRGAPADLLHGPLARFIIAHGGHIRLNSPVTTVTIDSLTGHVTGVGLASGEQIAADAVVLATPLGVTRRLAPPALRLAPATTGLWTLDEAPVISVQLWYDHLLPTEDNLIYTPDACFPVFADLARTSPVSYGRRGGSIIEACVAPAAALLEESDTALVGRVAREVAALIPAATGARIVKRHVTRLPGAIYRQTPGSDRHRPGQRTPLPNLFLAGCYTRQDYLASIEGAVRAGELAAAAVRALANTTARGARPVAGHPA